VGRAANAGFRRLVVPLDGASAGVVAAQGVVTQFWWDESAGIARHARRYCLAWHGTNGYVTAYANRGVAHLVSRSLTLGYYPYLVGMRSFL
jgi:hypothetical protein